MASISSTVDMTDSEHVRQFTGEAGKFNKPFVPDFSLWLLFALMRFDVALCRDILFCIIVTVTDTFLCLFHLVSISFLSFFFRTTHSRNAIANERRRNKIRKPTLYRAPHINIM